MFFFSLDVNRRRALGLVGEPILLLQSDYFAETYSASCLIGLEPQDNPVFVTARKNSNNQVDFVHFIIQAIEAGFLVRGDYIICDNARIHVGLETFDMLSTILTSAGIQLKYLPCYSPELNPIKLCFAKVKRQLCEYRNRNLLL